MGFHQQKWFEIASFLNRLLKWRGGHDPPLAPMKLRHWTKIYTAVICIRCFSFSMDMNWRQVLTTAPWKPSLLPKHFLYLLVSYATPFISWTPRRPLVSAPTTFVKVIGLSRSIRRGRRLVLQRPHSPIDYPGSFSVEVHKRRRNGHCTCPDGRAKGG
jgi:hypothetical protein